MGLRDLWRPRAAAGGVASDLPELDRRVRLALFAFAAFAFLLLQEGAITSSDGASMYQVTRSIVENQDLTVPPAQGVPGRGGHSYSKYGLGLPLVSVVPYVIAWPVAQFAGARGDRIEQAAVATAMPLISALLVVALYGLSRRLRAGPRASALVALGAVMGTYVLPYSKEFFAEPLTALAIVIAIERALAGRAGSAGLALALAGLTRPQAFAFAPVVLWVLWRYGRAPALRRALGPLVAGIAVALAYNVIRFGSLTDFGYGHPPDGFTARLDRGTAGLLFNPAKSIFLFAPIILMTLPAIARLWRQHREAGILLVANVAIAFLLAASWSSWAGGWSWGPRLLIPGIAPMIAAIAPWLEHGARRRNIAIGLFVAGFVFSAPAMLVSTRAQQLDAHPAPATGPTITRQYALVGPTLTYTRAHIYARGNGDSRKYLSLWQVGAAGELGRTGLLASLGLTFVLLLGAVSAGKTLRRRIALLPAEERPS